ncbi:ABC transporter ATP-binding protein [Tistrella mobilis]|uniref:ABC transporter related protein n=1 Tax=Tistrella mobilis (strain KA081020-065) TaxID=1110502 RepID=I3TT13_TISMK|nr:ABC transporter ATP-binding protein [Tistrella mobilis]AFK55901.1 ABC transporter related protein [Tistrella mobilis KA081020-065]
MPNASDTSMTILDVRELVVRFGGILAVDSISFTAGAGRILGLIGPNGAGKTTLFNCLSRLCQPSSGDILFRGRSLSTVPRHRIAREGIGRTFQNVSLFDHLDVQDNVLVGGHVAGQAGFLAHTLRIRRVAREEAELRDRARELIAFMGLSGTEGRRVTDLPFPLRKRVELARALMSRPHLLLLDEPAAGLNHEEVDVLKDQIRAIRDRLGTAILLVEHHMNLVMSVSDKVVAMNFGRKIAEGLPSEIARDPEVVRTYLGAGSS